MARFEKVLSRELDLVVLDDEVELEGVCAGFEDNLGV